MDPHIQYAKTSDGVNIACYALGSGQPFVWARLPLSHVQKEWQDSDTAQSYEAASKLVKLVRFDHRGFGLSDRDVTDFSLESLTQDLLAVVERLQLGRFILAAYGSASPMAITFAASHPEHVSHLVLYPGFARAEGVAWKQWEALAGVAADDWSFASEAMARTIFGWDSQDEARADADLLRSAVTPQTLARFLRDARHWDATAAAEQLNVPTLLLEAAITSSWTLEPARRLAALLPDARLVMIDGSTLEARRAQQFAAVAQLIGVDPAPAVAASKAKSAGAAAVILFTDIADSTALTERMGDTAFREASRALDAGLRDAIREAGGAAIEGKLLGDGVLATFPSAAQAIEGAHRCLALSAASGLGLHIGPHAGDAIREENNIFGGAVNIAARICALSALGEILVSDVVRGMARSSAGVEFADRGERELKGVGEPVRVFAIQSG